MGAGSGQKRTSASDDRLQEQESPDLFSLFLTVFKKLPLSNKPSDLSTLKSTYLKTKPTLQTFQTAGHWICHKGDPSEGVYLVVDGAVDVCLEESEGRNVVVVNKLTTNSFFGELSSLFNIQCTASVRTASSHTKLFHMRPVLFADFKPRRPELLLKWCTLRKYVDTASLFSDAILATQSVKACLTNIPLFRLWSSEAINCLAKLCKPMLFSEGSIVLEEGVEACLEMCVLLSGRIVFTAEGQVLVSVSAGLKGYWFGEEGLFLSEQRRCSVKADVLSQIVVIDRSQISYVLKQFPSEKRHYDKFMKHWESNRQRLDYSLLYKHKGLLDLEIIMERLRKTKELKDCSHIAAYQIAMEMSLRLGNGSSVLSHTDIGGNAFLVVLGTVELVKDNRVEESLVAGGYYDHRRSGKVLDARLTAVTVLALFPFSAVAEAFNE